MSSRRRFLRAAGAGAVALLAWGAGLRRAAAIGEGPVGVARLVVPGLPDPHPGAIAAMMEEVRENTSVQPAVEPAEVDPASPDLFSWPFVVLNGAQGFDPLSDDAVANLRLYLREGGFLFVDDASGREESAFDRSVQRDLARVLPGATLQPIGRDHAVYRSFFLVGRIAGRVQVRPYLQGQWLGDITPVLYSRNDLLGALGRDAQGRWAREVIPDGEAQRLRARKLGVNLVLFALTSNYKKDVVHVETLLQRMRRQGGIE